MTGKHKRKRKTQGHFWGIAIVLAGLIFVTLADMRIRPVVKTVAAHYGRRYATAIINKAVSQEIRGSEEQYRDLVTLHHGKDLQVTSLEIDMLKVNQLKTGVTEGVLQALEQTREQSLYFPLGTMLGSELFAGLGPQVRLRVAPSGYVDVKIQNHFYQAGINQVLHQVEMVIETKITAIVPGYTAQAPVTTNVVLAETIIVGKVPQAFTNVEEGSGAVISDIFDFGADKNQPYYPSLPKE